MYYGVDRCTSTPRGLRAGLGLRSLETTSNPLDRTGVASRYFGFPDIFNRRILFSNYHPFFRQCSFHHFGFLS